MKKPKSRGQLHRILGHRYVKVGIATSLALAVSGGVWLYNQYQLESSQGVLNTTPKTMTDQVRRSDAAWVSNEQPFSRLRSDVQAGNVDEAISGPQTLYVTLKDGTKYAITDNYGFVARQTYETLALDQTIPFLFTEMKPGSFEDLTTKSVLGVLTQFGLLVVLLVMAIPMLGGIFIKRKGAPSAPVTFDDIVGCAEAKQSLLDITRSFSHPEDFEAVGARPPRGVLLAGPPGTGKTQLAKALANECGVNFMEATGSDFSSPFYGYGIMKVKSLFRQARRKAPVIIFVDEIDGIGKRQSEPRFGEAEGNRIINQFLTELDGFGSREGVLLIAATNFAESLDPAMRREGRFDRTIHLQLPTNADRRALLDHYLRKLPSVGAMNYEILAGITSGLTPAAIASIVNQAALLAARAVSPLVQEQHLVDAIESHRLGDTLSAGSCPMSLNERKRIAIHEAGHAVVAVLKGIGRVDKVTILPRGASLGATLVVPSEDKRLHLRSELKDRLMMLLAGRCAETIFLGETSSGAANDLQEATKLAFQMVGALGMGPSGALASVQCIREIGLAADFKDTVGEVNVLLKELEGECTALLLSKKSELTAIVDALVSNETIAGTFVADTLDLGEQGHNLLHQHNESATHLEQPQPA